MAKGKFICDTPGCTHKPFKSNRALGIHKSYEERISRGETVSVFGKQYSRQGIIPSNTEDHIPVEQHVKVHAQQRSSASGSASGSVQQSGVIGAEASHASPTSQGNSLGVSSSNEPANDAEIPESIIDQMTDTTVQQRMRDINSHIAARRQELERPASPPAVVVQNYGQGQQGGVPPGPPEPEIGDWIRGIAEEGYKFFKNWNAQKAATLAPKEPSLAEIVGQRAIFRFIDGLSTAQGKATGNKLGKKEPVVDEERPMDDLVTRQEMADAMMKYKPSASATSADEHIPV